MGSLPQLLRVSDVWIVSSSTGAGAVKSMAPI